MYQFLKIIKCYIIKNLYMSFNIKFKYKYIFPNQIILNGKKNFSVWNWEL